MNIRIELGKPKKDGSTRAYLLIYNNGKKKRISTEIVLESHEFMMHKKKGLVIKDTFKDTRLKEIINGFKKQLMESDLVIQPKRFSVDEIVSTVLDDQMSRDFIEFTRNWILNNKELKGIKNYSTAIESFKRFLGKKTCTFREMTPSLLLSYQNSLADKPRAQSLYMAALRHLWNEADKMYDELPRSPFRKFTVEKQKSRGKRAVSIDIIKKIYEYNGDSSRAILARDCYILSLCLMGMNSADLYDATTLRGDTICYERMKTRDRREDKAYTEVVIPDFIKPLVQKYRGKERVFNFYERYADEDQLNRAINIGLGTIFGVNKGKSKAKRDEERKKAGILEPEPFVPDFYSARHSWATIARNDLRYSKYVINDALIHIDKDMDVTDLYILKDFKEINEANQAVVNFVFGDYMKK